MPAVEALLGETRWLRKLARDMVGDPHTAEDVVQDTFLAALRQRQRQRPIRKLRPWLQAVAHNLAFRSRQRDAQRTRVERESSAVRDEALPSAAEAVEQASIHRAVVDAVLKLPEPYRSTIVLHYLEALPLSEVASRSGVPAETARTRQKRGIAMLRARLDNRYGERLAWAAPLLGIPEVTPTATATTATTATTGHTVTTAVVLMTAKAKLIAAVTAAAAAALLLWQTGLLPVPPAEGVGPPADPAAQQQEGAQGATAALDETSGRRERVALPGERRPRTPEPRVVSGRVVDEETGAPIRGAEVSFWVVSAGGLPARASGSAPGTSTDGSGRFELTTHVPRPHNHLQILVRARDRAVVTRELPSTQQARKGAVAIDVGEIPVPPGTEVSGRVVDARGNPVPGAELLVGFQWIWRLSAGGRMHENTLLLERLLPLGVSEPDGTFGLRERLRPHSNPTVIVAVHARGVGIQPVAGLSRKRGRSEDNLVRLAPPGALDVEITGADGEAQPGVLVQAQPRILPFGTHPGQDLTLRRGGPLERHLTRRTDQAGRARFTALPLRPEGGKHEYSLQVVPPGGPPVRRTGIFLDPDEPTLVRIRLVQELCRIHGNVRTPEGVPVAGAQVEADFGAHRKVRADRRGRYSIPDMPRDAGTLYMSVTADGFAPSRLRRTVPSQGDVVIDVVLDPAMPLYGIVVDQHGNAVPGVRVRVRSAPGVFGQVTDERGMFRFAAVPGGRDHVLDLSPPESGWGDAGQLQHVATAEMSPLRLVLERPSRTRARLRARIVDAGGRSLEPEGVWLHRIEELGHTVWHETEARIGLVTGKDLQAGAWRLQVVPTQGHALERRFVVEEGRDLVELQLRQQAAGTIEGRVVFDAPADQRPEKIRLQIRTDVQHARWADVRGQPYAAHSGRSVLLDVARGTRFRITAVDPARPLVVRLAPFSGGLVGQGVARVEPGGHAVMELRARRCGWLQLRSKVPLAQPELELAVRGPGERWGQPIRFGKVRGKRDLPRWPVPPGEIEWRVVLASRGRTNGDGPRVASGRARVTPDKTVEAVFDPR